MKLSVKIETSDDLPPGLAAELRQLGVAPPPRKRNAPIERPKVKRTMKSQGWKPSFSGEEPPF